MGFHWSVTWHLYYWWDPVYNGPGRDTLIISLHPDILKKWTSRSNQLHHPQKFKGEVREIKERMGKRAAKHTLAYHTTSRMPTGKTPYSMVFGIESVIPVEIGLPNFRTSNFDKENNEIELRLNLDPLNEKREMAELHQMTYKCRVAKYSNQRVKRLSFLPGDLVLQKVTLSNKEPNAGKLSPTWEGPYKVIKVSRPGTYWLEYFSGKTLSHPWNAEHLKKYYQ